MSERTPVELRVVCGNPSPDELAALVAVLATRQRAAAVSPASSLSAWRDRERLVRAPLAHGPYAWRASARPR